VEAHSDNPCIVATCRPMTPDQAEALAREHDTQVLRGSVVRVTVFERRGDSQFDLGPFQETVRLTGDAKGDEVYPTLTVIGVTRGEITVASPSPRDQTTIQHQIDLGTFRSDRPKTVRARVEGEPGT